MKGANKLREEIDGNPLRRKVEKNVEDIKRIIGKGFRDIDSEKRQVEREVSNAQWKK